MVSTNETLIPRRLSSRLVAIVATLVLALAPLTVVKEGAAEEVALTDLESGRELANEFQLCIICSNYAFPGKELTSSGPIGFYKELQ